ncbi:hypothetical protein ACY0L5_004232 [Klebsiella michiganensis]
MSEPFKWGLALVFTLTGYALVFYPGHDTVPETLSRHWINDCRLLESNINRGFFSPAQNRLLCGNVIENVSAADYDRATNGNKKITIEELIKELFSK